MNPAKSYAHLFSPLGGEGGENYRAPGQLTFLRAPHVALETAALMIMHFLGSRAKTLRDRGQQP